MEFGNSKESHVGLLTALNAEFAKPACHGQSLYAPHSRCGLNRRIACRFSAIPMAYLKNKARHLWDSALCGLRMTSLCRSLGFYPTSNSGIWGETGDYLA